MMPKVFIDINVLLDFFLKRDGFVGAEGIFQLASQDLIDAYTSSSVLQTVSFYLQKDRSTAIAKKLLLELLTIVNVIEADRQSILQALTSDFKDIEDAIHYFCALNRKMDYVITSDLGFQKSALPILPIIGVKAFLDKFSDPNFF